MMSFPAFREYKDEQRSMLELVFAPCSPLAGAKINWMARTDQDIVAATLTELSRLFPTEACTHPPLIVFNALPL
jgi:15-cis-phytoene desaturase